MSTARTWVKLHASILTSRTFRGLTDSAARVFLVGLAEAGTADNDGTITAKPSHIADMAALEGGRAAAEAAVAELLAEGLLVQVDENTLAYPGWAQHQTAWEDPAERAAQGRRDVNKRWHRQGKHEGQPRTDCELCTAGTPSPQPLAAGESPSAVPVPADVPVARTMKAAVADFREAIPAALDELPTPFEGYTALLTAADDFAAVLGDLSKNARGALRNEVLAHALRNLVDEGMTYAGIARANKAAKALGDDGHKWWVHAAVLAAGKGFEDEKHCLNWMTTTARGERSKAVAA